MKISTVCTSKCTFLGGKSRKICMSDINKRIKQQKDKAISQYISGYICKEKWKKFLHFFFVKAKKHFSSSEWFVIGAKVFETLYYYFSLLQIFAEKGEIHLRTKCRSDERKKIYIVTKTMLNENIWKQSTDKEIIVYFVQPEALPEVN